MEWTKFILILGMTVLVSYTAFSGLLIGRLPISLSETYYELRRLGKAFLFHAAMITLSATLMPLWLDITAGLWYQFLVFLSCGSILFVACSPNYKEGLERKVHYGAAYTAVTCVILYHIFNGTFVALAICALPILISYLYWRNSVYFFAELSLILSVYLTLI